MHSHQVVTSVVPLGEATPTFRTQNSAAIWSLASLTQASVRADAIATFWRDSVHGDHVSAEARRITQLTITYLTLGINPPVLLMFRHGDVMRVLEMQCEVTSLRESLGAPVTFPLPLVLLLSDWRMLRKVVRLQLL